MSTREQIYVFETIKAMKKKIARDAIESDSDSEIQVPTNRGNKLKQKAKFVREGKLGPPTGPAVYKEACSVVEHTGYHRAIISRNPPLVDEDGYDIDSDDDEERIQDAVAAAAEADPYSSIRLEQLLAPLTSVTELPTHPTLSRPFLSPALTELANQGSELMRKENAALSKVRPLLTKLSGDHTWANCEMFLGPNDSEYFDDGYIMRAMKRRRIGSPSGDVEHAAIGRLNFSAAAAPPSVNGEQSHVNGAEPSDKQQRSADEDVAMIGSDENTSVGQPGQDTETATSQDHAGMRGKEEPPAAGGNRPQEQGTEHINGGSHAPGQRERKGKEPEAGTDTKDGDIVMHGGTEPFEDQRRSNLPAPPNDEEAASLLAALTDESYVHPIFLAPKSAHPDRDLGLPEQEAEDVRRLLQAYVQKQEEVCRGARKLYEGLLRADRMRKTVLAWSKAEAHCGPNRDMSDGEDWYDKDEWGLVEDLKKGQDEEEEDTAQPQKKTRNRNK
ncbi:hypothetical protein M406DRAFT_64604 [Cryphonectria parasitica EP155]|uniref:Transcriptional regulatory protein RXT2 N-terminal domain-containing protein n=1 Tax=Cryphonectria parasitica (strain ATCC 38755 / EP155) TaxID=660469 RepID=A0A9P5CKM5_CRYP1|nr:uncharacterized protein M406DRAFT_64604 [Cryphonectria parasitica EP155]KAF3761327.1 hypothetical protein M406DRAFT_64604 [Cryphonectria parasitica EP155]